MEQFVGSYPVVRKIGEGGMGRIYLVRDLEDGSLWAAKQFKGDLTRPLFVQRFRREFRVLKALDHPAIIQVKTMEYSGDQMFFLMEYVKGRSLDKVLQQPREHGPDWIAQVLRWIRYLCDPLGYIHSQKIIHRDIKPGNIMILGPNSDPPLKLLDFGVIQWLQSETITTSSHSFLGSLRYMAPEQMNSNSADLRSDLYSLGIILYEAVTGRAPFTVDNPLLLISLHQTAEPPPPKQFNLYVSDSLQNLMLTLLSKRPDDRPSSARELGAWIDRILDGEIFSKPDPLGSIFMTGMLFTPELSGREPELQNLMNSYSECTEGKTRIVSVHGTSGIGKSRLITQLQRSPDLAQLIICDNEFQEDGPIHNGIFYALKKGWQTVKKRQAMQPENKHWDFDELKHSINEITSVLDDAVTKNNQPVNLKMVAAQVLDFLGKLAQKNPIVLILDDLHLAKPGDINLLKYLIQLHSLDETCSNHQGLYIVISYRDDPTTISYTLSEFIKWLENRKIHRDIHLKGLNKIAVNRMITSMFGGSQAPVLGSAILEESEGNPLHVIEIIREFIDSQQGSIWPQLNDEEVTLSIPRANRITQMLGRRIDRFSENVQEVINAGAILGRHFRADELEQVSDIDDYSFLDQIDILLRHRIIEEDPFQNETYRFTHLKLQEAVYSKIQRDELTKIHHKAIDVLESVHAKNLNRVAERLLAHCQVCKLPKKILDYRVLASSYSNSMGDHIEAKMHIEKALEVLETLDITVTEKTKRQIKLDTSLGSLLRRTGDVIKAEQILLETLMTANYINDKLSAARVQKQLGCIWGAQAKIEKAVEATNSALEIFQEEGEDAEVIDCYINLGASYNHVHNFEKNLYYLRLGMEKAQLLADNHRLAMSLINIGISYACQMNKEALPYLNRGLQICEEINNQPLKAFALNGMVSAYMEETLFQDNLDKIVDLTNQVIEIAQKTGNTHLILDSLHKRSRANHHLGKPVLKDLDKAISMANQLGQSVFVREIQEFRQIVLDGSNNQS
ncbi:protein kinase [bacterium]|nr:protein kinase [bacterium]